MTPSLGTLIALPVVVLLAVTATAAAVLLWRYRARAVDVEIVTLSSVLSALLAVGLLVGAVVGMWPYDAEYHFWRDTSGTVKSIDSRLVGQGDGINQRFVVTFADGRQRACDDTRCSTVQAGDRLTLKCKRAYQWGATPGWDCNWVENNHPESR